MPKLHECTLNVTEDCIYLLPIRDLHLGDPMCNLDKLYRYRDWIQRTPNAYILLNGDICNTAIKSSVSDVYSETLNANEQIKLAVKVFEPVKSRILAMTSGNHERRIQKETSVDITEVIASHLGVYYAGDEAFLKIKFGKNEKGDPVVYTIYMTHGWGAGRTPGSKVNNLQKLSDIVLADLYIISHSHFPTTHKDVFLVPEVRSNNIREMERTYINTGAFLNRGGYPIQKGYPPSGITTGTIRLSGKYKEIAVTI